MNEQVYLVHICIVAQHWHKLWPMSVYSCTDWECVEWNAQAPRQVVTLPQITCVKENLHGNQHKSNLLQTVQFYSIFKLPFEDFSNVHEYFPVTDLLFIENLRGNL